MKTIIKTSSIGKNYFRKFPVKDFPKILILIITISLLISLCSCGGGLPSGNEKPIVHTPVDMNSYTVNYPAGSAWKMNIDRASAKVTFTRDKSSTSTDILGVLTGVGSDGYTYISVNENKIFSDTVKTGEIETSKDFMKNEVQMMKKDVKKDLYKLKNVAYTDTVIAGKKFYCMDYEIYELKNNSGSYFYAECKLALHFPSDFKESKKFYVFLINDYSNSIAIGKDSGQLYPVMASFKLKNEAL